MEPKRTARGRGFIAWLAPDLALTFALITLLSVFFVFDGATALFEDSDTGWHIRTGERIVSTRSLPHADPFSFSKAGEPWVACTDGRRVSRFRTRRRRIAIWAFHRSFSVDVVSLEPRGGRQLSFRVPVLYPHAAGYDAALAGEAPHL
jgi:hypothetical protein